MAKHKRVAREPMLYIAQPDFKATKPRMQSTYRSVPEENSTKNVVDPNPQSNEEAKKASPKKERTRKTRGQDKFGLMSSIADPVETKQPTPWDDVETEDAREPEAEAEVEEEEEQDEEKELDQEERPRVSFSNRKRRERFKDMSLEEKVEYFVNLPSSVPRMKCEVFTEEKSYRGWIQDYEDGVVFMKILQRPFRVEIPFDSIESIELKGF